MNKVTESANLQVDSSFKIYLTPHQLRYRSHELFVWPRPDNPDQEIATLFHSDGLEHKYLHYVVFT